MRNYSLWSSWDTHPRIKRVDEMRAFDWWPGVEAFQTSSGRPEPPLGSPWVRGDLDTEGCELAALIESDEPTAYSQPSNRLLETVSFRPRLIAHYTIGAKLAR
jgi:hypothetical protein